MKHVGPFASRSEARRFLYMWTDHMERYEQRIQEEEDEKEADAHRKEVVAYLAALVNMRSLLPPKEVQ